MMDVQGVSMPTLQESTIPLCQGASASAGATSQVPGSPGRGAWQIAEVRDFRKTASALRFRHTNSPPLQYALVDSLRKLCDNDSADSIQRVQQQLMKSWRLQPRKLWR